MTWAFLRLIGIRGALAILFALSTLTFYAMWKFEVNRKHKILAEYAKAQVEANVKRRLLEQELAEAQKKRPPVAPKIKEIIRENPSRCTVPKPVHDGLSRAIDEANAARIGAD